MAEATADEDAQSSEMLKYFCHQCACPIELSPADLLKELACPKCESGFIEEITPYVAHSLYRITIKSAIICSKLQ